MRVDGDHLAGLVGGWSSGDGPLYRQLADRLRSLITAGELRDGTVLPPDRVLARSLSVARGTVVNAYAALAAEGVVERRQGSGTRVCTPEVPGPAQRHRTISLFDESAGTALLQACPRSLVDLRSEMETLAARVGEFDDGLHPEGLWSLRELIATHMTTSGVPTGPEQILVCNGTQHGLALVLRALCQPGDVVLAEELTWPGLTDTVALGGSRTYGVTMDAHGVDTDAMRRAVERLRPAAIVVNPHHHNPTGSRLSPARRDDLAAIAADYGVPVIEDRVFAPLAFDGVVEAPIASRQPQAPVITVDSVSKVIWHGLRIGWVRASTDLIGRLRLIRAVDDLGTPLPTQYLAEQLFPRFDQYLAQRREELAEKYLRIREAVGDHLADWIVNEPKGGASLWATLPVGSARAFKAHAARHGVLVVTDEAFAAGEPLDRSIRLPFTAPVDVVQTAIEQLGEAWRTFEPDTRPPSAVMSGQIGGGSGAAVRDADALIM